jgi:hypothetical protein
MVRVYGEELRPVKLTTHVKVRACAPAPSLRLDMVGLRRSLTSQAKRLI